MLMFWCCGVVGGGDGGGGGGGGFMVAFLEFAGVCCKRCLLSKYGWFKNMFGKNHLV